MFPLIRWLCTVVVLLCACQGRTYSAPEPTVADPAPLFAGDTLPELVQQGTPQAGGTLTVAMDNEPPTLNHQLDSSDGGARKIGSLIYDTLAQPNPQTWQAEPHLAERWVIAPDNQTFTFYLRRNVLWDDGAPFTADDVIFTFEVLRHPKSNTQQARALLAPLHSVTRVDDYTVRFRFKQAYVFAFDGISETAIYPRHIFAGGDFNNHPANRSPVGTGPYRLLRWVAGDRIILTRNARYHGKAPALQQLVFRLVPTPEKRLAMLGAGELDVIERLTPAMWQAAATDPRLATRFWRLRHVPSSLQWLGYNARRPFFASAAARRALTMLVDRQGMVHSLRQDLDTVAASWFYPGAREYSASITPWPYDPVKAGQLLDQLDWTDHDKDGWRDNRGVPFIFTLLYPTGNAMVVEIAGQLRQSFAQAHIRVETQAVPWNEFTARLKAGNFDACLSLWRMVPHSDPYPIWHSKAVGEAGLNFVGFADDEADALLQTARETFDAGKRVALYQRLNSILHREEPYTMLFHRYTLSLVSKRLGGVYSTPYGLLRYEDFYLREAAVP